MIYKCTITKTCFVRANNKDEAEEALFDGDTICEEEVLSSIKCSNRREMQSMFFGGGDSE